MGHVGTIPTVIADISDDATTNVYTLP